MLPLDDQSKLFVLENEIKETRERGENVRRGLFARHTEMMRVMLNHEHEIAVLKEMLRDFLNRDQVA